MNYKWNDTEEKFKEIDVDRYKLETLCDNAAMKIYPVYKAFNLEMGDRVPTLHYLSQIIFELAVAAIYEPDEEYGWGGITVETAWADEDKTDCLGFNIGYHLKSIDYSEIAK